LVASVAEALAHYIDTVRPPTTSQQVFMTVQAPLRPIASSAIYHVVHRRFAALGIQTPHQGPHALRHACAARLVADGLTLKEIGDRERVDAAWFRRLVVGNRVAERLARRAGLALCLGPTVRTRGRQEGRAA